MAYAWENEQPDRCEYCGAVEGACHSFMCPIRKHPDTEPHFEPEYFSGLNWRDALPLVGHMVEFSTYGDKWVGPYLLTAVKHGLVNERFKSGGRSFFVYPFCRTCPETHAHPTVTLTVNGKEWTLPKPEREAPEKGTEIWAFESSESKNVCSYVWYDSSPDYEWLKSGCVHLTESRAQAWADFWQEAILGACK